MIFRKNLDFGPLNCHFWSKMRNFMHRLTIIFSISLEKQINCTKFNNDTNAAHVTACKSAEQTWHYMQSSFFTKYLSSAELLLLTSNFYSFLYYNSKIWHIPSIKPDLKQSICQHLQMP